MITYSLPSSPVTVSPQSSIVGTVTSDAKDAQGNVIVKANQVIMVDNEQLLQTLLGAIDQISVTLMKGYAKSKNTTKAKALMSHLQTQFDNITTDVSNQQPTALIKLTQAKAAHPSPSSSAGASSSYQSDYDSSTTTSYSSGMTDSGYESDSIASSDGSMTPSTSTSPPSLITSSFPRVPGGVIEY